MAIKEIKREWSPEQLDYVKHYLLHSESDVKDLPKCCIGSRATVGDTDHEYVCSECGWVREEFKELSAICPDLLTDPDVEITYDAGVTTVAEGTYYNDNTVKVIYLPEATAVENSAFRVAGALEVAILPKVKEIGKNAFYRSAALRSVYCPELTMIDQYGFQGCSALTEMYCPNLEAVYECSFMTCAALKKIDMPQLKVIEPDAFNSCTALCDVNVPNAEEIMPNAFRTCSALERLDLHSAVCIGKNALAVTGLHTLILRSATMCTASTGAPLGNTPISKGTGYIYVPAALIEDYKVAANWSTYANQFRAIEDYPDVCATDLDEPITKGEAIALANEKVAGVVKSVNGVTPDENGELQVRTPKLCLFMDASAMVPGMVQSFWPVKDIIDTYRSEQAAIRFGLEVVNAATQQNGPTIMDTSSDIVVVSDDSGNNGYKVIVWFGENHAPIIVNGLNNTITLDPDWVAPDASNILMDSNGGKWKLVVGTDGTLTTEAVTE